MNSGQVMIDPTLIPRANRWTYVFRLSPRNIDTSGPFVAKPLDGEMTSEGFKGCP